MSKLDPGKAHVHAALISAAAAIAVAVLAMLHTASVDKRLKDFAESEAVTTTLSIESARDRAARMIDEIRVLSGYAVSCSEDVRGQDYLLTLSGRGQLYPENEFEVRTSPEAELMLTATMRLVRLVEQLPAHIADTDRLTISGSVTGHADREEIRTGSIKNYTGLSRVRTANDLGGTTVTQPSQHDMGQVDDVENNRLLACARAARAADFVTTGTIWTRPQLALYGRAHKSHHVDGTKRAIDIELTFQNIRTLDPAFDICNQ